MPWKRKLVSVLTQLYLSRGYWAPFFCWETPQFFNSCSSCMYMEILHSQNLCGYKFSADVLQKVQKKDWRLSTFGLIRVIAATTSLNTCSFQEVCTHVRWGNLLPHKVLRNLAKMVRLFEGKLFLERARASVPSFMWHKLWHSHRSNMHLSSYLLGHIKCFVRRDFWMPLKSIAPVHFDWPVHKIMQNDAKSLFSYSGSIFLFFPPGI